MISLSRHPGYGWPGSPVGGREGRRERVSVVDSGLTLTVREAQGNAVSGFEIPRRVNQSPLFLDGGKAPPQRFQRAQVVEGAGLQLQLLSLVLEQAVDLLVLAMNPLLHLLAAVLNLASGMLVMEPLPQQGLSGMLLLQPPLHGLDQA